VYVADSMAKSGKFRQALTVYRTFIVPHQLTRSNRMRYTHMLILVGAQDFRQQRYAEAASMWREAAGEDPNNIEALYFDAFGLTKLGRYHEAVPVWKALIGKNESVGMFRYKYFATRRYRKQVTSRAWNMLGWCYFQLGDYPSAIHCRSNSMQAGPTDVKVLPDTSEDADPTGLADPTAFADASE
jgi:tetratricopeptide (TPR) repeat protein